MTLSARPERAVLGDHLGAAGHATPSAPRGREQPPRHRRPGRHRGSRAGRVPRLLRRLAAWGRMSGRAERGMHARAAAGRGGPHPAADDDRAARVRRRALRGRSPCPAGPAPRRVAEASAAEFSGALAYRRDEERDRLRRLAGPPRAAGRGSSASPRPGAGRTVPGGRPATRAPSSGEPHEAAEHSLAGHSGRRAGRAETAVSSTAAWPPRAAPMSRASRHPLLPSGRRGRWRSRPGGREGPADTPR